MIGKNLFHRFFWRYLMTLILALGLLIFITHWYQARHNQRQYQLLEDRAKAWQSGWEVAQLEAKVADWRQHAPSIRLLVGQNGQLIADSHPERGNHAWEYFKIHKGLNNTMEVAYDLNGGYQAVFLKPYALRLTYELDSRGWLWHSPLWRLVGILFAIAVLISLLLYPLVRGLSRTFLNLSQLAEEVASGHFGKTLDVKRRDELGGLVTAFNHMSHKLAEAEQLNKRLIHDVSHELRSPLGRIRVLADTLQYRPQELESCVDEIHREIALLDRMVEDMIQAAKMEVSGDHLKWETFELYTWATGLNQRFSKLMKSKNVGCDFRFPTPGMMVAGDRQRLTQAVGNLVENALTAVADSPDPMITVSFETQAETWQISVLDNGVGIPLEEVPHVFRRFYRVDDHRNREEGGVGLGLSIVKAIVESHKGEIFLTSEPEEGTQVALVFPRVVSVN